VLTLSDSLQPFELREMVAKLLIGRGAVAQNSLQGRTGRNAEVVVDRGGFRTHQSAKKIVAAGCGTLQLAPLDFATLTSQGPLNQPVTHGGSFHMHLFPDSHRLQVSAEFVEEEVELGGVLAINRA